MDDAIEWLRIARSNLKVGKICERLSDDEIRYEELCFELQQCAEKTLKALLVHHRIKFPKTHSIAELLNLLIENSLQVPVDILNSAKLTQYAVETRYPEIFSEVTEEEYKQAIKLAETVFNWVSEKINLNEE